MTSSTQEHVMPLSKDEIKEAAKEAFRESADEFLDKRWAEFGKWSMRGFALTLFAVLMYLWAKVNGLAGG
jgi:hypothetical protein